MLSGWKGHAWLGGKRVDGAWRWFGLITSEIGISYWGVGEPNGGNSPNLCLSTYATSGRHYYWNDHTCTEKMSFACEKIN